MKFAQSLFIIALSLSAAYAGAAVNIPDDAIRYDEDRYSIHDISATIVVNARITDLTASASTVYILSDAVIEDARLTSCEVYIFNGAQITVNSGTGTEFYVAMGSEVSLDHLSGATIHYDQNFGGTTGSWQFSISANWVYDAEAQEYVYIPTPWRWSQSKGWYQP